MLKGSVNQCPDKWAFSRKVYARVSESQCSGKWVFSGRAKLVLGATSTRSLTQNHRL